MKDDLEYHEISAGVFTCTYRDSVLRCVACDKPREYALRDGHYYAIHKCSERTEAARRGAQRRGDYDRRRSEAERLHVGLSILEGHWS